ncbi:methylenetetrahydrofolate reductase [NAD(P)H] [Rhodovulum sp. DZ06]|uniref:methylenetetrahydrofolate reductase [NAD(P)H] n=1 Tax=Rhodovulum sp. DZ06 TaxID=3425126 RepID=UPI003D334C16
MSDSAAASTNVPAISFEFFPPATPEGSMRLWRSVERLAPLGPDYVSVTYGAGGTTRDRTLSAIQTIVERARLTVAGHLTCVNATKAQTLEVAEKYRAIGARRIVALRGDPPKGASKFEPHPEGFASAAELVAALAKAGHDKISVAAYPEMHPEASSLQADIDNLKRKLDAGADQAITQFFFDNDDYFRFLDAARKAGIDAPIIPGILPIENFAKMSKFAAMCGAKVPEWMGKAFETAEEQGASETLSVSLCAEQCQGLAAQGVEQLHVYTLNNPDLPYAVCRALGVEAGPERIAAAG